MNKVKEVPGADFPVESGEARKGEYSEIYANTQKSSEVLKWQPKRSLQDSAESLVKWYQGHPKGWGY